MVHTEATPAKSLENDVDLNSLRSEERDDDSALRFDVGEDDEDIIVRGILEEAKHGLPLEHIGMSETRDRVNAADSVKSRKKIKASPKNSKPNVEEQEAVSTSRRPIAVRVDARGRPILPSAGSAKQDKKKVKSRPTKDGVVDGKNSKTQDKTDSETATPPKHERPAWQLHKEAMRKKLGAEGWNPRKKLSPDSLNGIRALHESDPKLYTTPVIAAHMKISPEAVRRILKSQWRPKEDEIEERRKRWEARGVKKRQEIKEHKVRRKVVSMVRNYDLRKVLSTIQ